MQKANPKAVGGFVVGAVILAVSAIAIFGTGKFFEPKDRFVAFFTGSYSGLRVGSPVTFRGVPIGKVVDLWVRIDPETLEDTLPVICEIEVEKIRGITPEEDDRDDDEIAEALIERGLRAQLVQDSFVTGQQSVRFVFRPDTEPVYAETNLPYQQWPTIPSTFDAVESNIEKVAVQAAEVLDRVNDLLNDENRQHVNDILAKTSKLIDELHEGTDRLDVITEDVTAITGDLKHPDKGVAAAVARANETLDTYKSLGTNLDGMITENRPTIQEVLTDMKEVRIALSGLVDKISNILDENQQGLKDFSNEGLYEITNLAVDLQGATEQLRRVLEELETDPARFLLGEPGQREIE